MLIHPHLHHRRAGRRFASGLTLIELLVVLMVLIAVAGIVVPNVTSARTHAQQTSTEQTLISVRTAILGANGQKGLWHDLGERDDYLPKKMADLLTADLDSTPLSFSLRVDLQKYDHNTRLGWRGPYLQASAARFDPDNMFDPGDLYGNDNDPAVLDGWGNPIIIQFPEDGTPEPNRSLNVRLVSAGANGELDIEPTLVRPDTDELTEDNCGDDVVLFLRVAVKDIRPRVPKL